MKVQWVKDTFGKKPFYNLIVKDAVYWHNNEVIGRYEELETAMYVDGVIAHWLCSISTNGTNYISFYLGGNSEEEVRKAILNKLFKMYKKEVSHLVQEARYLNQAAIVIYNESEKK